MVVCEEGTLLLEADGSSPSSARGRSLPMNRCQRSRPAIIGEDWADNCPWGEQAALDAVDDWAGGITEPALLAVKATRYPGQELRWGRPNFRFSNHDKANQEILSRTYREGFAPPQVS
jgi:hypothetical protein